MSSNNREKLEIRQIRINEEHFDSTVIFIVDSTYILTFSGLSTTPSIVNKFRYLEAHSIELTFLSVGLRFFWKLSWSGQQISFAGKFISSQPESYTMRRL